MKNSLIRLVITGILFLSSSAIACPEFQDVDLAGSSSNPTYEVLSTIEISLSKEEFYSIPLWAYSREYSGYERCKGAMSLITLKHKTTGRIFKAIASNEDGCDGGNAMGALYSENLILRVGDIGDSFISCY